ncbi:MAG: KH domain-containing protein [Negativicutes bacterium]|nr:KH domain-containing protein [Negativicutes bacterium]
MKALVETIAKALVKNPDAVEVTEARTEWETTVSLKVAPEDMGKVIGKQGRIAKAIRTMVKASSARDDRRINVEIM